MCKSLFEKLFVSWICKKLNKRKVKDLDESIGKIRIEVHPSHSFVFLMNKNI